MTALDNAQTIAGGTPLGGDAAEPGHHRPQLEETVEMLRELSRQRDPQKLVEVFRHRSRHLAGGEYLLSLSRRGLQPPWYRITRHADWPASFNPWDHQDELPLLRGGLLGELIYGDEPRIVPDLSISPNDPGRSYLRGARSILALPQYDSGIALNMVVRMSPEPYFFDQSKLPDALVMSNLFGRATYGLVLAKMLDRANTELEHELELVGRIQRSLLPDSLPHITGLDIAVSYETATRAGGDYYDFFPLCDGQWGIMIADARGHGAPAAVVMAVLRTNLHARRIDRLGPAQVLNELNRGLIDQSSPADCALVTAFYAVYDPSTRIFRYSVAGHVPPLLIKADLAWRELADVPAFPLAVSRGTDFLEASASLSRGDTLLLFTDGVIEAFNRQDESFGMNRLVAAACRPASSPGEIIGRINGDLARFVDGAPGHDDRTLVALRAV